MARPFKAPRNKPPPEPRTPRLTIARPYAFGLFIQPAKPPFAGTVGQENCAGQSVAAVTRRHGGMLGAARALGYASVEDLQAAIDTYCNG
jgi:hypothetical protein